MGDNIEWRDIRADKTDVTVCHEEAQVNGRRARIWAPSRIKPGKEWEVEVGAAISHHRSHDLARASAEKRLRAAARQDG